jgi:predicted nucleic acid-binding protein
MPRRLTEADSKAVHTSVQLIHEAATVFKSRYPRSTFQVLLVPSAFTAAMGYETTHRPAVLQYLQRYRLEYLDLGQALQLGTTDSLAIERYAIIDDGHPNPRGQEFLARQVIAWLWPEK